MDVVIQNLCKSFGEKQVLKNFNLTLKHGETTCLMADSGYGKTTLARILANLDTADSGNITAMENAKIAYVFQEERLLQDLNPVQNIAFACPNISQELITSDLKSLGLTNTLDKAVKYLSGGEQRRISLIRACLADSNFVILDEPFKGLDAQTKEIAMTYCKAKIKGKTTLLITHDQNEKEFFRNVTLHPSHE